MLCECFVWCILVAGVFAASLRTYLQMVRTAYRMYISFSWNSNALHSSSQVPLKVLLLYYDCGTCACIFVVHVNCVLITFILHCTVLGNFHLEMCLLCMVHINLFLGGCMCPGIGRKHVVLA